jgi:hypothetical protein
LGNIDEREGGDEETNRRRVRGKEENMGEGEDEMRKRRKDGLKRRREKEIGGG